jgi:hypothetical protein
VPAEVAEDGSGEGAAPTVGVWELDDHRRDRMREAGDDEVDVWSSSARDASSLAVISPR